ncbi:hypothetical protein [Gemmatimonas sp.]|jgi:hypothetical protein|uniref:hypothetical protein n=1 Tax=Gemmatimonas sp. TaxID=1962908 RepID=UPI00391B5E57
MHDLPALRRDEAASDSGLAPASSPAPVPLRRRHFSPVSGEASGRLRVVTYAFGLSAGLKTVAVIGLVAADLLNVAAVEQAMVKAHTPVWWPLVALIGVTASWMTYRMLKNRRRAAIFAAGVPAVMGLVAAAQSGGAGIGVQDVVINLLLLATLVSVRNELD